MPTYLDTPAVSASTSRSASTSGTATPVVAMELAPKGQDHFYTSSRTSPAQSRSKFTSVTVQAAEDDGPDAGDDTDDNATVADIEEAEESVNTKRSGRVKQYMMEELDQHSTRIPLSVASFVSGFIGCTSFSACSIWVGFQSGNTVQTFIAISRAIYDPRNQLTSFNISDWQALTSILSFALACQFGGRVLRIGQKKSRARIVTSGLLQVLLTIAAALTAHYSDGTTFNLSRENPSWHNPFGYATLALLSISMGLQGVVGESLGTGLTATVVLTSIYCQLAVLPSPRRYSKPRDDRLMAIVLFGLGGFIAHYPLSGIGSAGTLGIAAGIRALLIPLWLLCKNSEGEDVLPFHRRSDTQDSEGKRQSQNGKGAKGYAAQGASLSSTSKTDTRRLEIVHTDTNATLVERPRQFKPRFGHIAHSDSKGDRPSTAPH